MDSPFKKNVNHFEELLFGNARIIEWNNKNNTNSPTVFTKDDYSKLINADKKLMFARKFSEVEDIQIIEMMYAYLCSKNTKEYEV